jgi:hypothetical protein
MKMPETIRLRNEGEIVDRLKTYIANFSMIKNSEGQKNIRFIVAELNWVLGNSGE